MYTSRLWVMVAILFVGLASPSTGAAQQGLIVDGAGNVGVNTTSPTNPLTVVDTGTNVTVLSLERPASSAAQMRLLTTGSEWTLRAHGSGGKFRIDEVNTSGVAFDLKPDGQLELSNGLVTNGDSTMNGNLVVNGEITEAIPSARALKTDIRPIDSREMLRRVAALPIYSWRYKSDEAHREQIGPMAEEFREAIGIGDGSHLPGHSAAGISLAAIRGLNEIVQENERVIAALRSSNEELSGRVAILEKTLEARR